MGYSPWGHTESDTTEHTHTTLRSSAFQSHACETHKENQSPKLECQETANPGRNFRGILGGSGNHSEQDTNGTLFLRIVFNADNPNILPYRQRAVNTRTQTFSVKIEKPGVNIG